VLRAEYALLNDPSRLADLAGQHLAALKTTAPTQFTTWAEFEKRLPPVGAPPSVDAPPLEPEAPTAKLPEPAEAAQPADTKPDLHPEAKPETRPEAKPDSTRGLVASRPAVVAMAVPAVAVANAAPARPVPRPAPAPAAARPPATPVSLTAALQQPPPLARANAAPPPRQAPHPMVASALGMRPPPRTVPTYTPASYARSGYVPPGGSEAEAVARIAHGGAVDPSVPAVASALGMARSMTPSPVASASAATLWQPGPYQTTGSR
jgi:hypothetical protein